MLRRGKCNVGASPTPLSVSFRQGGDGDNADRKPGFGDRVAGAKWDAWNKLKGTSQEDAMQQYVDLMESLSWALGAGGDLIALQAGR